MPLGLSKEALELRRNYLMASDAKSIMEGEWRKVSAAKRGAPEEDLSDVLAVQMGSYTEPFNMFWCEKQTGREVRYSTDNPLMRAAWKDLTGREAFDEFCASEEYPWMACSLDGWFWNTKGHRCVLDAKHVGQFSQAVIERYTPQLTHQATVMGFDWWALSIFVGNSRWQLVEQEVDPFYQAELISAEREFWELLQSGAEIEDRVPPAAPPSPQPLLRVVQLDDQFEDAWPNWAVEMNTYISDFKKTHAAAAAHAISREQIKGLMPEDVGLLTRENVSVARDRRGVTISLKKGRGE